MLMINYALKLIMASYALYPQSLIRAKCLCITYPSNNLDKVLKYGSSAKLNPCRKWKFCYPQIESVLLS